MNSLVQINRPVRERTIKVSEHRGVYIRVLGLQLFFGADRDKVFFPLLETGRLDVLHFPRLSHCRRGWLALYQIKRSGSVKMIAAASYDSKMRFFVNGEPARDKKGEVIGAPPGQPPRCTNADTLFPVLSRVWRVNNAGKTGRNFIAYDKKPFILPTDRNARYGPAACEEKIAALVLPDQDRIHFYDRSVAPHRGKTRHINWLPLSTPGRKGNDPAVYLADQLEEFRLKDIPVGIKDGKAFVLYRGVKIAFSVDTDSRYYPDLAAERLFMRAGRPKRLEAVRKSGTGTRVLGKIAIEDSCLVVGDRRIRLDHPEDGSSFAIEDAIEALGGREVKLEPGKLVYALCLRIPFPEKVGNFYRSKLLAGQISCVIYRDKLVVGYREQDRFTEIGRVLEEKVQRGDKKQPRVDLVELIPELGYSLDLASGDRYYKDWRNGQLIVRTVNGRRECCAVRPEGIEFIGSADRQVTNNLVDLFPALKQGTAASGECSGLNLLKRQVLLLAGASGKSGRETLGLYLKLSRGLAWLNEGAELSAELKDAFAAEIRAALFPWQNSISGLQGRLAAPARAVELEVLELPEISEPNVGDPLDELDGVKES